MKLSKLEINYRFWISIFLFFSFSIGNINSQESLPDQDSLAVEPIPFALSEIPSEFNNLTNHLLDISEVIQPDDRITNNAIITKQYFELLQVSKQDIIKTLPSMTYQRLENLIRAWYNYKEKFDVIQETLKKRIDEIESVKSELDEDLQKWQKISDFLGQGDLPEELKQSTDSALVDLNLTIAKTIERSDTLLLMRSKQTQLNLLIDEMIRVMEEEQKVFQSNYFIIDSNPIWSASDSTTRFQNVASYVKSEAAESYNILKTYLWSNKILVFLQLAFIIILIIGFTLLRRIWPTNELNPDSKRETQAGYIIRHPFFSSLLISILISYFFYSNRPLVLEDFFIALMLISSLVLLPGLLTQKIKMPLILLAILFLLNVIQDYLPYHSSADRMIFFIQGIATLGLLLIANKIKSEFEFNSIGRRIFTGSVGVFAILLIVAIVSNIIGSVKLADFLISSTIGMLTVSVLVVTIVIILNSMMVLLIKGKKAQSIPLYEQLKNLIDKRIRPLINLLGLILWLYAALGEFRLLNPFQDLIGKIMDTEFSIASVTISIGAVISFFLIILFTYILVRFIKNIFKDDWVAKSNLPRGTADALSMLTRYTIIAFGIYLALHSIGLDMNKFGFLVGALGIGIGFGLQNVVLNFIAGLILTFENPIHIGDVIEVDQYMGRVTEIGARATKVLTWDGSEIIVPNGLLISNKVVNWTLTNQKRRLTISIKTPFDADPEEVIEILSDVAQRHPNTHGQPAPMALFNGYESSALDFTLYCWVEFNFSLSAKSEIAINAIKALAKAGIAAPMPTQKIKIDHEDRKHLSD